MVHLKNCGVNQVFKQPPHPNQSTIKPGSYSAQCPAGVSDFPLPVSLHKDLLPASSPGVGGEGFHHWGPSVMGAFWQGVRGPGV